MNGIVLRDVNICSEGSSFANPDISVRLVATCRSASARAVEEQIHRMKMGEWRSPDWINQSSALFRILAGGAPRVERVIFNDQATIVFWDDGEKTVVKCRECGDGRCIYDKDFDLCVSSDNTVIVDDISQVNGAVENIARCSYCQTHFDSEKAIMAAMLKRLHPNFQDVMRDALGDDDE